jgi:hypothetical protein
MWAKYDNLNVTHINEIININAKILLVNLEKCFFI